MIQYIKRENLDILKYNACIENSIQSRVYAFSWYLDIVAHNWAVLVLNDYEAVMPIPWKRKLGLLYISQPFFCQQLGVFSKANISETIQNNFIEKIPSKFLKVSLNFNSENSLFSKNIKQTNYILELSKEYITIYKDFSKGRKHAIKVGEKSNLSIKTATVEQLLKIYKEFYKYKIPEAKLLELNTVLHQKEKGQVLGVFKNNDLLGGGLFIKYGHRIIYLFSAFSKDGRDLQASSFLIAEIIKRYEKSNYVLDFEGGNMPNIGKFYRSFGAKEEIYSTFNSSFL